jgi:hypothetical protein
LLDFGPHLTVLLARFLYTLFIALDACFRLKRRLVSSELKDPDLGSGWAYMVDTGPYRRYLRTVTNQKEVSRGMMNIGEY